jgi:hypothetical protein
MSYQVKQACVQNARTYETPCRPLSKLHLDRSICSHNNFFPEWIKSGVLKNVRQIGIELHTGPVHIPNEKLHKAIYKLIQSLQQLYEMGFRMVSYSPNGCMAKSHDVERRYYSYFDIVLYKP